MRLRLVALCVLLATSRADAGKAPLTAEQREQQSALIVTGQVLSHREQDQPNINDGTVARLVFLTVKVETVVKGKATPGDSIEILCWAVVKEPANRPAENTGHDPIPNDGGRAKFYLQGRENRGVWHTLTPNGVELLDQTPPLVYERAKGPAVATSLPLWATLVLLVALAGALIWRLRRPRPLGPSL